MKNNLLEKVSKYLTILLLAVFLPVLFCVIVVGNHMDYYAGMKLATKLPEYLLSILAVLAAALCVIGCAAASEKKSLLWEELSARTNRITNGVLAVLFLFLYIVNMQVAKEIVFQVGWDVGTVRSTAYQIAQGQDLGYQYYYSMYSNNIPIAFLLSVLYRIGGKLPGYPYYQEFLWIQMNCMLISMTGYFTCLTVKKLTRKMLPTILSFGAFLLLVGISPWKIVPYTDTYGLIFPIAAIYFYVSYRIAARKRDKYINLIVALLAGVVGGLVKPTLYIVVIAVWGAELLSLFYNYKERRSFFWFGILITIVLLGGNGFLKKAIITEIGLDFNPEIEASWHHYFYMGLNEKTTGGYHADDAAVFGEFQEDKEERRAVQLERAMERIEDRGFLGSIYFYLKKLVMTFHDGTFGWKSDVWFGEPYPVPMSSDAPWADRLREIFWCEFETDEGGYSTLCQLVWNFVLLGIPGICLCKGEKRREYTVLVLCFLGIFFYQMLFEARARYLLVFSPIMVVLSVCGMQQYAMRLMAYRNHKK